MRDLKNNSVQKELLPAKQRGIGTATGDAIDLKGEARKLLVLQTIGNVAAGGSLTVTIQESADNSTWDTLKELDAASAAGLVVVDLTPTRRYVRAVGVTTGATVDYGVLGIFYNERYQPSSI